MEAAADDSRRRGADPGVSAEQPLGSGAAVTASWSYNCLLSLNHTPRIAIIGCGLMGRKRAAALRGARITVCCDVVPDLASGLAATVPGCRVAADWRAVVSDSDVD